jgi:hypothetical protein
MHQWAWREPGYFMHYGPVTAPNLDAAKAEIRMRLGVSRLPRGIKVWDLSERPMERWRVMED